MFFFVKLENRGLIHVEGKDRHEFLQGLITNDIHLLAPGKALYACLLTPQGKFLHDFFVSGGEDFILLECEGGVRARDLYERLNKYRLRADVQISVEENLTIFGVLEDWNDGMLEKEYSNIPTFQHSNIQHPTSFKDPRHPAMGWRSFEKPQEMEERPFAAWDTRRITLCIPDGSRDLIPEKSTLDEGRIDQINGVNYEKGCYVGQELTARMHYRGLGKKHLQTVRLNRHPETSRSNAEGVVRSLNEDANKATLCFADVEGSNTSERGPSAQALQDDIPFLNDLPPKAELRSQCGNIGLALVREEG